MDVGTTQAQLCKCKLGDTDNVSKGPAKSDCRTEQVGYEEDIVCKALRWSVADLFCAWWSSLLLSHASILKWVLNGDDAVVVPTSRPTRAAIPRPSPRLSTPSVFERNTHSSLRPQLAGKFWQRCHVATLSRLRS